MNDNKTAYTKNYMVRYTDAINHIDANSRLISIEAVNINQSRNRISAEKIVSGVNIPSFDNSAMDGYAVLANELVGASEATPTELKVAGLSAAGDSVNITSANQNTAWKIMTGAPVPKNYDSIIPVENTQLKNELVECFSEVRLGAHIRLAGEDFRKGDQITYVNQIINANTIMALASIGLKQISVYKKPKIGVFSTGKELVDDPDMALKPGQIRNSNMPYIINYLQEFPVEVFNAGTNYDDVSLFRKALQKELDNKTDIIISTGAVSMGDFDFIPNTIIKMGGEIIFHKIKLRPGKPILFAKFPNGSFYVGLPGNPISATVGLRLFVSRLIANMLGQPEEVPQKAKLDSTLETKNGLTFVLKAKASIDNNATNRVEVLNGQESFKIHPLLKANGWLLIPDIMDNVKENTVCDFYPSFPYYAN